MGTYFKSLRRKIGVVTVVIACVVATAWIRNLAILDTFSIGQMFGPYTSFRSESGDFFWDSYGGYPRHYRYWFTDRIHERINPKLLTRRNRLHWSERWQIRYAKSQMMTSLNGTSIETFDGFRVIVPYPTIVIPLTLLSAWLLLSKPRSRTTALTETAG